MSVIVKDMRLPAGCALCRFEEAGECLASGLNVGVYDRKKDLRFPLCPLADLPPHGDLIDRDALRDRHADAEGGFYRIGGNRFMRLFENAPAVIPSDLPPEEEEDCI